MFEDLLVVLLACLVLLQSLTVLMVAQQSEVETLTAFHRRGHGWTTNNQSVIFDTGEMLELLQFCLEAVLMRRGNIWTKFEEHYEISQMISK